MRHLPARLVGPVHGDARGEAAVIEEGADDLVVDLAGEDRVEDGAADAVWFAEIPVDQVDRVGRIVVQAAAALGLVAAPGAALCAEHDGAVRLSEDAADAADRACVEKVLDLAEAPHEPVVIPDLRDHAGASCRRGQLLGVRRAERERLLAEDVQAMFERGAHQRPVRPGWRRDQDRVEINLAQHRLVAPVGRERGLLPEHASHIARRLADRCDLDLGVHVGDREVREAHLAEPDDREPDHVGSRRRGPGRMPWSVSAPML